MRYWSTMESAPGGGEWMAAFLFPIPLLIPVFPILAILQYIPYPFMSLISQYFPCLYIFSTLLEVACLSPIRGIGHHLLFDVLDLSNGLSFEQKIGLIWCIVYLVSLAVKVG